MKTNIYKITRTEADYPAIAALVAEAAGYGQLSPRQMRRLLLLSEELIEMLPHLLLSTETDFWIEAEDEVYEVHASISMKGHLSAPERARVLSVSSTGKNAAAVGIMNKIRIAAEIMIANYGLAEGTSNPMVSAHPQAFYSMGMVPRKNSPTIRWSLSSYKDSARADSQAWDELEKSVIANAADDVTVGIINQRTEITVTKRFTVESK